MSVERNLFLCELSKPQQMENYAWKKTEKISSDVGNYKENKEIQTEVKKKWIPYLVYVYLYLFRGKTFEKIAPKARHSPTQLLVKDLTVQRQSLLKCINDIHQRDIRWSVPPWNGCFFYVYFAMSPKPILTREHCPVVNLIPF